MSARGRDGAACVRRRVSGSAGGVRAFVIAAAFGGAVAMASCAPLLPAPSAASPPPQAQAPAAPQRPPVAARPAAPIDSTPSPAALAVLATIPEPLRASERVPAPDAGTRATDTTGASNSDTGAPDVPVPSPTLPLGERRPSVADTVASTPPGSPPGTGTSPPASPPQNPPPTSPPASAPPASPPAAQSPSAASDTCWRVQIAAPLDAGEAESIRAASASLLLVDMVIERETGRYKVRNRDCLTRDAADGLRRRAVDSGFTKAFRVTRTNP